MVTDISYDLWRWKSVFVWKEMKHNRRNWLHSMLCLLIAVPHIRERDCLKGKAQCLVNYGVLESISYFNTVWLALFWGPSPQPYAHGPHNQITLCELYGAPSRAQKCVVKQKHGLFTGSGFLVTVCGRGLWQSVRPNPTEQDQVLGWRGLLCFPSPDVIRNICLPSYAQKKIYNRGLFNKV